MPLQLHAGSIQADVPCPRRDGDVIVYNQAVRGGRTAPRIYYVNGVRTDGPTHAKGATVLSILAEGPVIGVFNASAERWAGKFGALGPGALIDYAQCLADWIDATKAKLIEIGTHRLNAVLTAARDHLPGHRGRVPTGPVNVATYFRSQIPDEGDRARAMARYLGESNLATAKLFLQLSSHRSEAQWVVAHSQGNLIAANALWAMVVAFGETSLDQVMVFSLASPVPAWPLGLRGGGHKVYGHKDDLVTLADPHNWVFITSKLLDGRFGRAAGDWRTFGNKLLPGLAGHDLDRNIALNFFRRFRELLHLPAWEGSLPKVGDGV